MTRQMGPMTEPPLVFYDIGNGAYATRREHCYLIVPTPNGWTVRHYDDPDLDPTHLATGLTDRDTAETAANTHLAGTGGDIPDDSLRPVLVHMAQLLAVATVASVALNHLIGG